MWIAQKDVKDSTTFNLSMDKTKVKAPPGSKKRLTQDMQEVRAYQGISYMATINST